jgi:hypothetical protein
MPRYDEPFSDPELSSPHQSCPDCIIATRGYDFWEGQVQLDFSRSLNVERNRTDDRFDRALLYATHVHGGQVRKGTSTPYVAHLLAVTATVLEYDG